MNTDLESPPTEIEVCQLLEATADPAMKMVLRRLIFQRDTIQEAFKKFVRALNERRNLPN
jgi:hypothetical protein